MPARVEQCALPIHGRRWRIAFPTVTGGSCRRRTAVARTLSRATLTRIRAGRIQSLVRSFCHFKCPAEVFKRWRLRPASIPGNLCPSSNPYPCAKGARCSRSPFKPLSGPDPDCDGGRLDEGSICCPNEKVVDCNNNTAASRCKVRPSSKCELYIHEFCTTIIMSESML